MSKVRDVLEGKGFAVFAIGLERTVFEAIHIMDRRGIGCLVVLGTDGIAGILTERDCLRKVALLGRKSRETRVDAIMSTPAITVDPTTLLVRCLSLMTESRIRQLPVTCAGELVGIISMGDIVKWRLLEREAEIHTLIRYIQTGSGGWAPVVDRS